MIKRRPNLSLRLVALAALTLCGCEDCTDRVIPMPTPSDAAERFARAACMAESDCGCGLYESTTACESELVERFDDLLASGVTLNEDCFEEYLASELLLGCPTAPISPDAIPQCVAMVGSATVGEPCLPSSLLTLVPGAGCQSGLTCSVRGVCGDAPAKQSGDPCDPEFVLACGQGLYCGGGGVCAPRVPEGQSCDEASACESGWFCDGLLEGAGVCTPQLVAGDECEPEELGSCAGPSRCHHATSQCDDMVPFLCINLALPY